jgi:hypothetical protein
MKHVIWINAILLICLILPSCKDSTTQNNSPHNFELIARSDNNIAYIGAIAYASYSIKIINNEEGSFEIKPDANTNFEIIGTVTSDKAILGLQIRPLESAKPGKYTVSFSVSFNGDVQKISIPIELKIIPKYSHLIANVTDTLFIQLDSTKEISVIPVDSSGNYIKRSFFDSLGISMGCGWGGSNSMSFSVEVPVNTTYFNFQIKANKIFQDSTNIDPVKFDFMLASKIKNIYAFVSK